MTQNKSEIDTVMSTKICDMRVETTPVLDLHPHPRNARTHSKRQIKQIAASIERFGWTNPVLIDEQDQIIAGHGRVAAAKLLGKTAVPSIRLENMSEAEIRAYVIADNRLAELAEWDKEILAIELQTLVKLDFEVEAIGFEIAEIDLLIDSLDPSGTDDEGDKIPSSDRSAPPVAEIGDLWLLGRHRLLCGDATKNASFKRLLDGERAHMVFTDPPYNVPIHGNVCGLGQIRHAEFAMASGEMSEAEFIEFLNNVLEQLAAHSTDGALHYVCMDWRHIYELLTAARDLYSEFKNMCIWKKTSAGMGSLYRSQHELVCVFKYGSAPHINNVELGRHGRYRTNVWQYAGINTFSTERIDALAMHPTVKPVALVADAIRDCTRRGDIILDAFSGSGTTLIAAERAGRRGYAIEIDPHYVDVALKRFRDTYGEDPVHEASGFTFSELSLTNGNPPREAARPRPAPEKIEQ